MAVRLLRTARHAVLGRARIKPERASWRPPRASAPPPCPPGWQTGPPDFIGVGSQKSGTSWWFSLLNAHPEVQAQVEKELRALIAFRDPTSADALAYARWFPRPRGKQIGEWTPAYMACPWVGRAIAVCAPEAKLLATVRDPVERYRSGVPQWRKYHSGDLGDAKREDDRARRHALRRGFYGEQLTHLAESVRRERILVLQYEQCARDPRREFAKTLDFLGLSPWEPADELLERRFAAIAVKEELSDEERQRLVEAYIPDVGMLQSFAPDLDLSLWPNFASMATQRAAAPG